MKRLFIIFIVILLLNSCMTMKNKHINDFNNRILNMPDLKYILNKDEITRLDVAYLFGIFFPEHIKRVSKDIPFDLRMKYYPNLAFSAIENGFMKIFPDGSFKPDEKIKKYQLAIFFSRYMLYVDPFFDVGKLELEITDVNTQHFAYKPIAIMVSRKIMSLDENGNFYPFAYVSGNDAIHYFYNLSNFYK